MKKILSVAFLCTFFGAATLSGCSQKLPDAAEFIARANPTNVHRLTNLYQMFTRVARGRGPKSEKMFKDFIARVDPAVLEQMGVSRADLDQLFVSERDLQPLRVVYGMKQSSVKQAQFGKPEDRSSQHGPEKVSVVRESDGVDGKVLVGFVGVGTSVEELPSAEAPPVGKRA